MTKATKAKRPKKTVASPHARVVYEITVDGQVRRVEASTVTELRELLYGHLRDLDAYALAAVARLATEERAVVSTSKWGVKRVGVLQFTPDNEAPIPQKKRGRRAQSVSPETPSQSPERTTAAHHPAPIFAELNERELG